MPKPRTPTNVLALKGAFKKHPERKPDRADEPVAETVNPATLPLPLGLTELEVLAWRELAPRVHAGTFAMSDLPALVTMARLYAHVLFDEHLDLKVASALLRYLAMFGMTPADRSRVKVAGKAHKADPDDEFFGAAGAA